MDVRPGRHFNFSGICGCGDSGASGNLGSNMEAPQEWLQVILLQSY